MKKQDLIQHLIQIYDSRPPDASSYRIITMLLFATENRGWLSPPGLLFARFLENLTAEQLKELMEDASWDKEEGEYDEE